MPSIAPTPISTLGATIRICVNNGAGIAQIIDVATICYNAAAGGSSTQTQSIQTYGMNVEANTTTSRNEGTYALDCFHSDVAAQSLIMAAMLKNVGQKVKVQMVFNNGADVVPTASTTAVDWTFAARTATSANELRFDAEIGTVSPETGLSNLQREKFVLNVQSEILRGIKGSIALITRI
jgi:hypothetical protein